MTSDTIYQLTGPPVMKTQMLIRKPARDVFEAFADPAITARFWFTKSSARIEPGAELEWKWEMYNVSAKVKVKRTRAEPAERYSMGRR